MASPFHTLFLLDWNFLANSGITASAVCAQLLQYVRSELAKRGGTEGHSHNFGEWAVHRVWSDSKI